MTTDLAAVNPETGEILEHLEQQPPDALAEALDAVRNRQAELKRWNDALEDELRRRLKARQATIAVFGEWEVESSRKRESEWDADELEPTMQRLADEGVIRAGDWTDVITRDPIVSRSRAGALLGQLDGAAAEAVKACRTWKEKRAQLTVTRSVELIPAAEEAPPVDAPGPPPAGLPQRSATHDLEDLFA